MRTLGSLAACAATLAGCAGPTSTRADLDRVANEVLDLAEATLPALAESLGATLTEVLTNAERQGGSEGSTPRVFFTVHGTMAGPEPTQADLERALADAGFVVTPGDAQPSDVPDAHAVSADGTTKIGINYSTPGGSVPGIQFSIRNVEAVRVSNATVEDFRKTFAREFDQSLVHEAPESGG